MKAWWNRFLMRYWAARYEELDLKRVNARISMNYYRSKLGLPIL